LAGKIIKFSQANQAFLFIEFQGVLDAESKDLALLLPLILVIEISPVVL
jgi:hypothetical protein